VFLSSSEPEKDYINASFVDVSKLIVIFYSHEVYSTTMCTTLMLSLALHVIIVKISRKGIPEP